jgi:hypothetical protein
MIKLATLGIPALLVIIMLTSQSAFANEIGGYDCQGEWHCVSGWNNAIGKATSDFNSGLGYDYYVYYWQTYCLPHHTYAYCDGYAHSYAYEWNTLCEQSNEPTQQSTSQYINIHNYGNGNTFIINQITNQGQNQSP